MTIIEAKDHGESFKAVDEGRAVAFPMDDVLLYGLVSRAKKPDDFAVVGKYFSVEPYAIMLRRDEPQFERIVNRALIDLFTVRGNPPHLREVVHHPRPDGAAQSVSQGSLRGAEHVPCVALTSGAPAVGRDGRLGIARIEIAVARPERHQRRQRELLEFRTEASDHPLWIRTQAAIGDEAELHALLKESIETPMPMSPDCGTQNRKLVDRRAGEVEAGVGVPERWSSPPSHCARAASSS